MEECQDFRRPELSLTKKGRRCGGGAPLPNYPDWSEALGECSVPPRSTVYAWALGGRVYLRSSDFPPSPRMRCRKACIDLTLPYPHEDTHRLFRNSAMPYAVARFRVYTRIPQANRTRFSVEILTPRAPEEPSHRCCFGWLASPLAGPRDAPAAVCFPSPTRAGARVVAAEMPSREEMVSREEMASRRSPKQREMPFRTRAAGPADS